MKLCVCVNSLSKYVLAQMLSCLYYSLSGSVNKWGAYTLIINFIIVLTVVYYTEIYDSIFIVLFYNHELEYLFSKLYQKMLFRFCTIWKS